MVSVWLALMDIVTFFRLVIPYFIAAFVFIGALTIAWYVFWIAVMVVFGAGRVVYWTGKNLVRLLVRKRSALA